MKTGQLSAQGTPQKAQSFDLAVKDKASGTVKTSIELTTVDKPMTSAAHITDAIEHVTSKTATRATEPVDAAGHTSGTPLPIPGTKEAVIHVELLHGESNTATDARTPATGVAPGTMSPHTPNQKSVVLDGLGSYRFQDYAPTRPSGANFEPSKFRGGPNPVNIIDDILANLNENKYARPGELSRIRIEKLDGTPVAEFVRSPSGTWTRL